jgi:hypothetical protein
MGGVEWGIEEVNSLSVLAFWNDLVDLAKL